MTGQALTVMVNATWKGFSLINQRFPLQSVVPVPLGCSSCSQKFSICCCRTRVSLFDYLISTATWVTPSLRGREFFPFSKVQSKHTAVPMGKKPGLEQKRVLTIRRFGLMVWVKSWFRVDINAYVENAYRDLKNSCFLRILNTGLTVLLIPFICTCDEVMFY